MLPSEGNAEGPMSIAAAGPGRFVVLDQINNRVTLWTADGKARTLLTLPGELAADIAVGGDGTVAVLDRLGSKQVSLFDRDGKAIGVLPLDEGVGAAGKVTGVFVDGQDVYVERAHGPLVLLGSTTGAPRSGDATEVPGRPSRDGKLLLSAGITERDLGRVYVSAVDRASSDLRFTREIRLGGIVQTIVGLDSDKAGVVYAAFAIEQGESTPTVVVCLDPVRGQTLGSIAIPTNSSPEESMRELTVLDDGQIILGHRLDEGMSFEGYRCP